MSKAETTEVAETVLTLDAVLGLTDGPRFQLAGRVFTPSLMTLGEASAWDKTIQGGAEGQATELAKILNARLIEGKKITPKEVTDNLSLSSANRLVLMLNGQFKSPHAADGGAEGK